MGSSTETIGLIEHYYAAFNSRRDELLLELLTDDVIHDVNQGAREIGKSAFREFLGRMRECYDELITDLAYCSSQDGSRWAGSGPVTGRLITTVSSMITYPS